MIQLRVVIQLPSGNFTTARCQQHRLERLLGRVSGAPTTLSCAASVCQCDLLYRRIIGVIEIQIDIVADQVISRYVEVLPDLDDKIQRWPTFAVFKIVDVGVGVGIAQLTRKRTEGEPALGP